MSRIDKIGNATLYLGDCREILPTLGKFDAVVTDPPYGIGIASNPVRQMHAKKDWDDATPPASFFDLIRTVSKEQIIWGGNYFPLPPTQCFLVWDKVQPQDFSLAMCEMAWCSMKAPAKMFSYSVLAYKKQHPTQKPVPLMEWCLRFLPKETKTVLDPFMGSGTTGVAAINRGFSFVGIERDSTYFDVACERISEAVKSPGLF